MQAYAPGQGVDLGDGIQLRTHYEGLRGWLEGERASWLGIYGDLARFVLPKQQRFNYSDTNNGERRDYRLMDNTGTMAHRVLTASLVSGICSPTRNWFDFKAYSPHDRKINERKDVRIYLEETADIVRASLLRSNWYQTAHTCFGEQSLYGTSAFMIQEDALHDARCSDALRSGLVLLHARILARTGQPLGQITSVRRCFAKARARCA